jgi:hypothetical protein
VSLSKGEAETKSHEAQQQICFSVNYPNGKDRDLYSAKRSKKKAGIIFLEPITVGVISYSFRNGPTSQLL